MTGVTPHLLDDLVDGIRARSNDAFTAVYQMTADDLASFAFGLVGDRKTAEDIVQQAFLELVRAAPGFRGDGRALRAWLFRSVRFGCLDEYRRRRRHPEVLHQDLPDTPVEDSVLESHLEPALESALASLGERQRVAVILRNVAGLDGDEIAGVMRISRRAVYGLLERGEAKLKKALGDDR